MPFCHSEGKSSISKDCSSCGLSGKCSSTSTSGVHYTYYYHFRSTLKRDDFLAYVYFSNVTVSQTSVSSGPMKMRCFGRETNNVCQTTVACFVHVAGRFSSFRLYFSSYNLLIGWQVLGFQILSRITQMTPVQIKVVMTIILLKEPRRSS